MKTNSRRFATQLHLGLVTTRMRRRRSSMGCAPENQVRTGLAAGGKEIRTLGPARERVTSSRGPEEAEGRLRCLVEPVLLRGDREFESPSLQRGVFCELTFGGP